MIVDINDIMSISKIIASNKRLFSFNDFEEILQLSQGYTRRVIGDLVRNHILATSKAAKDKRKVNYTLNWPAVREYLLQLPKDYEQIIENIAGSEYDGMYVAINDFKVIQSSGSLMDLTKQVGILPKDTMILISSVGRPKNLLILETT